MIHSSPLRYPGGKGCLAGLLATIIDLNGLRGCRYFEPFAGGAGAALELLKDDVVSEIHINDADIRISSFWKAAVCETDRFVDRIFEIPLNIEEWSRQELICSNPRGKQTFELGFSAFFMNRCNRSGVMKGAGPIGGKAQAGKWKLDVRFNRETLASRILALGRRRERIHISNEDAMAFLKNSLPRGTQRKQVLVFLDPPYVNKGQRLYLNAYGPKDHGALAGYVNAQKTLPWIMTYDDTELIRDLYAANCVLPMPIRYSLNQKVKASELMIAPKRLHLPQSIQQSILKSN